MSKFIFVVEDGDKNNSANITCAEYTVSGMELDGPVPPALIVALAIQELTSGRHNELVDLLYARHMNVVLDSAAKMSDDDLPGDVAADIAAIKKVMAERPALSVVGD